MPAKASYFDVPTGKTIDVHNDKLTPLDNHTTAKIQTWSFGADNPSNFVKHRGHFCWKEKNRNLGFNITNSHCDTSGAWKHTSHPVKILSCEMINI